MKREGLAEHAFNPLMPGDVRDYLLAHPDFLIENGDLLTALIPPVQRRGDGVQDFQHHMLARLQEHFSAIKGEHDDLMELMQEHLQRQNKINASILSLLDAPGFEAVLQFVTQEMAVLLDQEAVVMFLEAGNVLQPGVYSGMQVVAEGFVHRWMGDQDIELEAVKAAPEIFGEKADAVKSQALIRLKISDDLPQGLLALGHRESMYYATGLATEQVECLAAVIERCVNKWLTLPT